MLALWRAGMMRILAGPDRRQNGYSAISSRNQGHIGGHLSVEFKVGAALLEDLHGVAQFPGPSRIRVAEGGKRQERDPWCDAEPAGELGRG